MLRRAAGRRYETLIALLLVAFCTSSASAQIDLDAEADAGPIDSPQREATTTVRAPTGTRVASKLRYYKDNDQLTVVTPIVSFSQRIYDTTTLGLTYTADIVTAATVDVRTHATPKFKETRNGLGAHASHRFLRQQMDLSGFIELSREADYESMTVGAGISKDLFEKNLTLAGGYAFVGNVVGRSKTSFSQFADRLQIHALNFSATETLSPKTLLQLSGSLIINSGYQASVYRYVPIYLQGTVDPTQIDEEFLLNGDVAPLVRPPETLPRKRYRYAGVAHISQYLPWKAAIAADYRFYSDSWSVRSHTIGVKLYQELPAGLELRLRNRFYTQTEADFYQATYVVQTPADLPQYFTIDRELSTYWYDMPGIKLTWRIGGGGWFEGLAFDADFDAQYAQYNDFNYLPSRWAFVTQLGASADF